MNASDRLASVAKDLAAVVAEMATEMVGQRPPVSVDRLLTVSQAAERLAVGRTTVYLLVTGGELQSIKVRGRRLIPESAIVDFIGGLSS